jgi:hypothetical protein
MGMPVANAVCHQAARAIEQARPLEQLVLPTHGSRAAHFFSIQRGCQLTGWDHPSDSTKATRSRSGEAAIVGANAAARRNRSSATAVVCRGRCATGWTSTLKYRPFSPDSLDTAALSESSKTVRAHDR